MLFGCLGGVFAGVALVDEGQFYVVSSHLLNLLCQAGNLLAIASIGWSGHKRQQVAECVDRDMRLHSLASFGSLIARPRIRFLRRLQGATVDHHCRRLSLPPSTLAHQQAHILHQNLKTAPSEPALYLLIQLVPGSISFGRNCHGPPEPATYRTALKTERRSCLRCALSSRQNSRYGSTNAHSSSVISPG